MAVVVPGTIPSLPVAFDVQGDDLVLIYQPGQTPSTRAAKVSDVGGVPSTNPVFSGTVTADGVATANVSGTDGLTLNGGSNGVTVAGGPIVIPTMGRLLVGDGATTTASGSLGHLQFNQINVAGTITDTAATLNNFAVPSDTADAISASNTPAYLGVNANFGGTGFGGGRAGFRVQMTQTGDIGAGALTGANFWMNGGGHAAPNAQFYSGNFQTQIAPNTTGIGVVLGGGEINVQIGAGSTTASKAMLTLIQEEGDAVQGTNYDTALGFSNQGNTVGWDNILSVGRPDGVSPMRPDGTIFGAYLQTAWGDAGRTHQFPALATGIGIDWSLINFSKANGYFLRGPGGFSATGKGEVTAGNAIFGPTASGVQIDIPNQIVTAVAVANGGGGGGSGTNDYYAGDIFYDGLGGQYEATGVDAGAVTAVSILAAGVSASPPANPVTVTGGSGTGLTLTLTWSARNALALNPSGGATSVGGALSVTGSATLSGGGSLSGAFSGGTFSTGGTFTGKQFQVSAPVTFSTSAGNAVFRYSGNISGTTTESPATYFSGIQVANDTVVANSILIDLYQAKENLRAGATGSRTSIHGYMNVLGTPGDTGQFYLAVQGDTFASANAGGTSLSSPSGSTRGGEFSSLLGAGATFYVNNGALELSAGIESGASSQFRSIISIEAAATEATRGAQFDAGISFSKDSAPNSPGLQYGIAFGHAGHQWYFASDSALIAAVTRTQGVGGTNSAPLLADRGIDFGKVKFTTHSVVFPGTAIDPTGQYAINNATIQRTSSGIAIDIPNLIVTGGSPTAAGGGFNAADLVYEVTSGSTFSVTVNGSGGITALTLVVPGSLASAPGSALALSGGNGTGATVTLTTAANKALSLNPSGGNIIMSALPTSASGLPSGALWNNSGVLNIAP